MFKFKKSIISILLVGIIGGCSSTEADAPRVEKIDAQGEPEGYEYAGPAKKQLKITGTVNVAFGAKGKYFYKYNQTEDMLCDRSVFGGDPIKGTVKKCYIQKVK